MGFHEAGKEVTDRRNLDPSDSLETIPDAVPVVLTKPAIEDQLAWHTLWPESHKLYGHGNELFSLCCNNEGSLVASSCKVSFLSLVATRQATNSSTQQNYCMHLCCAIYSL